jgi:multiple sugar transport system substrate-binding protein
MPTEAERRGLTRRQLLGGVLTASIGLLAACGSTGQASTASTTPTPTTSSARSAGTTSAGTTSTSLSTAQPAIASTAGTATASTATGANSSVAAPPAATAAKAANGHLTIWHASGTQTIAGKTLDGLIHDFQQQNPAIQADHVVSSSTSSNNFEKLTASMAGGEPPDVMSIDVIWPAALVAKQAIRPLDSYLDSKQTSPDGPRLDDYYPGPLDACTIATKTYALPYETSGLLMYYNQDMFKVAGLDPAAALATWSSFRDAAVHLTKRTGSDFQQMGFLIPRASLEWRMYSWAPFVWQAGGEFVNADGTKDTFNQPPGVAAAQFWTDLVNKDQVTALKQPAKMFEDGKAGTYIQGPGDIVRLADLKLPFAFGTALLPKDQAAASDTGGWNWSIASQSKRADEAWAWLEWSGRVPQLVRWSLAVGAVPPRKSARDTKEWQTLLTTQPAWKAALDTLAIQRARPKLAAYTDWSPIVSNGLEQAVSGAVAVQQALDAAARLADAVLAKA